MKLRFQHGLLALGGLITFGYLGLVWFARSETSELALIDFVRTAKPNEVGDFFAGLFSPIAFLWLVIGYLLQSRELSLQRQELSAQREELKLTRGTMEAQVDLIAEQTRIEAGKILPFFTLNLGSSGTGGAQFYLTNTNAIAYNVEVMSGNEETPRASEVRMERGNRIGFNESREPKQGHYWHVYFDDASTRRWVQHLTYKNRAGVSARPPTLVEEEEILA